VNGQPVLVDLVASKSDQKTLVELSPDSMESVQVGMPVLCILCTRAERQWDDILNAPTRLTSIGVVPVSPGSSQYVRVGLAIILDPE
jgi:hypothetical protein